MVKQRTYRFLVWAVVILLATNISMAVSFLYHKKQDRIREENITVTTIEVPTEQRARFFREQLNLSPEQMNQVRDLNREYNRATNIFAHQLEDLRLEMISELGKENPDLDKLNDITSEIGELHKEIKNNKINYYQKMNAVCGPQQQKRLNEIFMSMLKKTDEEKLPRYGRRNRFRN